MLGSWYAVVAATATTTFSVRQYLQHLIEETLAMHGHFRCIFVKL